MRAERRSWNMRNGIRVRHREHTEEMLNWTEMSKAKTDCPTVLKLILIFVHSQLETKEREYQIPNCDHRGSEGPQMHPRVGKES